MTAAEPHLVDAATWKNPTQLRKVTAHVVHSYAPDKAARDELEPLDKDERPTVVTIGAIIAGLIAIYGRGDFSTPPFVYQEF